MLNFIKNSTDENYFVQHPVICFSGHAYPILFFSLFSNVLKRSNNALKTIDFDVIDQQQLMAQLTISFLGARHIFWAGSIDGIESKKKKAFFEFVRCYTGPHTLCFFSNEFNAKGKKNVIKLVHIPHTVDSLQFQKLFCYFFGPEFSKNTDMSKLLLKKGPILIEHACLLMHYNVTLSKGQMNVFINEWLDKILTPEKSLFTLSAYLFAQRGYEFFDVWQKVRNDYPTQFWLTFWSDQLFRASCFVRYAKDRDFVGAKKISARLPFTFIKKDWKRFDDVQLKDAHQFLYNLDFSSKNGGSTEWFELFFQYFF